MIRSLLALALLAACGSKSEQAPMEQLDEKWAELKTEVDASAPSGRGAPVAASESAELGARHDAGLPPAEPMLMEPKPPPSDDTSAEALRKWFPEAFLWQPLVETDENGAATVDVRVPDTLTTWRVLALAHTREGSQAGAIHTFDSRLPVFVEPVVPGWLFVGDRVIVPIQVANTTDSAVQGQVSVEPDGTALRAGQGGSTMGVSLPAFASSMLRFPIVASARGTGTFRAALSGGDGAVREIPVLPTGRLIETVRGGTLSKSRAFRLESKGDATTEELSVLVFPGPLAMLMLEMERNTSGATPWEAAYGFALAGRLREISLRMKLDLDEKKLRRLEILSWQRIVPFARAMDGGSAADLLSSLRSTKDHELARQFSSILIQQVEQGQRADGTWARQSSGTLQQVIVQTAFTGRSLPEDRTAARGRASAALERLATRVDDPYTAAVVAASGLVDGDTASRLRERLIQDGIVEGADGVRTLAIPATARNPWGGSPSRAEALAWAILALEGADADGRGDLVAELMAAYDARRGFGAGPADVIALEAIAAALPGLDRAVQVVLSVDGTEVGRASLDPSQPKVPAVLSAPHGGAIELRVEPEIPGIAFVGVLRTWVPWRGDESLPGVDVRVRGGTFVAGEDGSLTFTMSAPAGTALRVEQGLPPGAAVDESVLSGVSDRVIGFVVHPDRVELRTRAFQAGEVIEVPLVVRPAFAGEFSTVPLRVREETTGAEALLPPRLWSVSSQR